MPQFNVHDAKSNLSGLLDMALEGEEIVISRHGMPVVQLTPVRSQTSNRVLGEGHGTVTLLSDNWADPMTAPESDAFWDGRW